MVITVKLTPQVASTWPHGQGATKEAQNLQRTLHQLGMTLEPMHPGIEHPVLSSYFTVTLDDSSPVHEVMSRLLESPAVEGAYVKPSDEPA
jgi:hypothetical protein